MVNITVGILTTLALYFFARTKVSDPGIIPRGNILKYLGLDITRPELLDAISDNEEKVRPLLNQGYKYCGKFYGRLLFFPNKENSKQKYFQIYIKKICILLDQIFQF